MHEQYSSVFTWDDSSELPQMEDSVYQDILPIDMISLHGIIKLLSELDPIKLSGPDHFPPSC